MDPTVILELAKEALKTFNLIYEDQPAAARRAGGMFWWNVGKAVILPMLTADQRKQLDAIEKQPPTT